MGGGSRERRGDPGRPGLCTHPSKGLKEASPWVCRTPLAGGKLVASWKKMGALGWGGRTPSGEPLGNLRSREGQDPAPKAGVGEPFLPLAPDPPILTQSLAAGVAITTTSQKHCIWPGAHIWSAAGLREGGPGCSAAADPWRAGGMPSEAGSASPGRCQPGRLKIAARRARTAGAQPAAPARGARRGPRGCHHEARARPCFLSSSGRHDLHEGRESWSWPRSSVV